MQDSNDCPICIDPLDNEEIEITECNHTFHKRCLDNWKKISKSCPYCRRKIDGTYLSEEEKDEILNYYHRLYGQLKTMLPEEALINPENIDIDKHGHHYLDMINANNDLKENRNIFSYTEQYKDIISRIINEMDCSEEVKTRIRNAFEDLYPKILSLNIEDEEYINKTTELYQEFQEIVSNIAST